MKNHEIHTHTSPIPFVSTERNLGVIVGYDASEQGTLALHYAARAAQRRGTTLTVVHAFTVPPYISGYIEQVPDVSVDSLQRQGGEEILDKARAYLKDYPGEVTYRLEEGDAAGVLVHLSQAAELAVVGGRGRGGFLGRVLGSVASALPGHATCPTVVVPRAYDPEASGGGSFAPVEDDRPVTVGIDGSSHSRVAALHAAQAAADRGVTLRMIIALPPIDGALLWYPELGPREDAHVEARRKELEAKLDAERAWLRNHFPDVEVLTSVETGESSEVLSAATSFSQLTVVGTRGRGGLASVLLGSTSRGVLLTADGPVMVVPRLEDERLRDEPHFGT
ncbi:universal stress protein [Nesterenkonia alba]|uniref:universal stress protein n=1 Tax=Nesterenkonia alba TaxID=515814 RepID=UPI0003B74B82|nr:universal stress protein [Nesterenkonia alba]